MELRMMVQPHPTTITFKFSGHITPENVEFDGQAFDCQLDDNTVEVCPGVLARRAGCYYRFDNLSSEDLGPGPHTFSVQAFVFNNVGEGDREETLGNIVTFKWNIVVPVVTTTLDSQTDGFGHGIENDGSTASDTITFTFTGHITPENVEFDGQAFYCQLDDNTVEVCPGVLSESEPGVFTGSITIYLRRFQDRVHILLASKHFVF